MRPEEYELMRRVEESHWWYQGLHAMVERFLEQYAPPPPLCILDAGCGTGAVLTRLQGRGCLHGVDFSPIALSICRARGLEKLARGSADALPCGAGRYDVVLSLDVLTQGSLRDKSAVLREAYRVLKPGGWLFLNVPAYQCLFSAHDVAIRADRRMTRGEVQRLLIGAGFRPRRITYWNTLLLPPAALVRLWRKRHPERGSDLESMPSPGMNRLLAGVLALERQALRSVTLPFGLSIFAVADRK